MTNPFQAPAGVANHEATKNIRATVTQVRKVGKAAASTVSTVVTGQPQAAKQDATKKKNPKLSLGDAEGVAQGVQAAVAQGLQRLSADIAALHAAATLPLAQPGALPDELLMGAGKKPTRDATVMAELSRSLQVVSKRMASGQGVVRHGETRAEAAKTFWRQAGAVIYDTAGTLVQACLLVSTRALKYLVRVSDFDIVALSVTTHANQVVGMLQKLVLYVAQTVTISVGKKLKLVLLDGAEVTMLKARIEALESMSLMVLGPEGLTIDATRFTLRAGVVQLTVGPEGFNVTAGVPLVVPQVAPLPVPTVAPVQAGPGLKGPAVTPALPGQNSAPAVMPKLSENGTLR